MITSGEQCAPRRRLGVLIGVAAVVLAADLASKAAVVALLSGRPRVRLLGGVLTLMVTRNPGAAFGIGGPAVTVAFTAIAAGVAGTIVGYSRRVGSIRWAVALGLLLGGAMDQVPALAHVQHRGFGDYLRDAAGRGARGPGHRGPERSPGAR
jgi:signal peptidase II